MRVLIVQINAYHVLKTYCNQRIIIKMIVNQVALKVCMVIIVHFNAHYVYRLVEPVMLMINVTSKIKILRKFSYKFILDIYI